MSREAGAPAGLALHASAVAIEGKALLILGRSRSGKSRLAATLVGCSSRRRHIALIGDDRILLTETARGLEARPHPRIAGFIERRGLGFVAIPWLERTVVAAVVRLDEHAASDANGLANLPTLALVPSDEAVRAGVVLAWWHTADRNRRLYGMAAPEPAPR